MAREAYALTEGFVTFCAFVGFLPSTSSLVFSKGWALTEASPHALHL